MIDKLYSKAAIWTDYLLPGLREQHPLRANLFDAAVLSSWSCWLISVVLIIGKLLNAK